MFEQQPPKKTGLIEFIKASIGSQFVIPVYQRNYTWTSNREVKQYFDDLENILNGKYTKHFLGILIYLDTPIDFSTREFSIIDGQQRLTTTFLILYAIKDLMLKNGLNNEAMILENQVLINQYVPDKLKLKLKPLVADDEVYQNIVLGTLSEVKEKNSNVYKNYLFILEKLENLLKKYSFNDILMALDKLYIVTVPVLKTDSPQKIFESINSTGSKLCASDLIRNYILMDIQSDTQEKFYNLYWKSIENYVTSDSKKLESFFRLFLAAKTKMLSNITSVYINFKEWFEQEKNSTDTESILKEIVKYSRFYNNIYIKPIDNVNIVLRDSLADFRCNLSEMPAPFFMEIYNLCESIGENGEPLVNYEQFNQIIQIVNTYLIRRAICGLDTSDITRLFPTLLKDVLRECGDSYHNIVEYTKKNLVNKQRGKSAQMPTDDYLRNYLQNANVYNLRLTLRIIFDKIETLNNPAPVNLKKLSIEHLMPQTPTKEWLDALEIDEITYENHLHRLGNLTLATKVDNSKMKNKPWEYKKAILLDTSHLIMNQEILKKDTWTIKDIDERNNDLIDKIISIYPYFLASDEFIAKHDIYLECDGVQATAILYEEDGSVEIQAGSQIVDFKNNMCNSDWQFDIFNELLLEGYIKETENGAIFVKPYLFSPQKKNYTALSVTAGLILCGSRNGWEYWKDSNGKSLNENTILKNRITGK